MTTTPPSPTLVPPTPPRARRWVLPAAPAEEPAIALLAQAFQPSAVAAQTTGQIAAQTAARILVQRGITTVEQAEAFLHASLAQLLDPFTMTGMHAAVLRIQQAVAASEPILIYGDYDVDGTTAVVLLKTAIERIAGPALSPGLVHFHVPHRLREGYGMQAEILRQAAQNGVRLVISVDTGIRAFAAAEAAQVLGLDLIVTDHHLPEGPGGPGGSAESGGQHPLPRALAILNPNQPGCAYACKGLCGAGVAFKLSQALLQAHAGHDPDAQARLRDKLLPSFLKMLAIATIADSVPLQGENRAIVALGLAALRQPASPGLRALMQVAQLDPAQKPISATDVGFRLGPRINAAGRMDVASDVVELFTTRDPARATALADQLDQLNTERRATEALALEEVLEQSRTPASVAARCLVLDGAGWHRGVIGILASRVVEATGKPALVIAHEAGEAYGSGRSVEGFHLLNALESCAALFTRFGGHAHAAGFSLPSAQVPALRDALTRYAATHVTDDTLAPQILCDLELPLDQATPALYQALRQFEPFGMDNPEPTFIARDVTLVAPPRTVKDKHCKLQLAHPGGTFNAMAWHWAERVRALNLTPGDQLDLAYRLRMNEHPDFGGLELDIVDLRRAKT